MLKRRPSSSSFRNNFPTSHIHYTHTFIKHNHVDIFTLHHGSTTYTNTDNAANGPEALRCGPINLHYARYRSVDASYFQGLRATRAPPCPRTLKRESDNSPASLNQDDILLVEQFVNSLRLDLRQHRLEMRSKNNKIECLSKQLKREQDRNRELRQTQSTKRENAATSVDAWRNWADDMKAMERAWQKWAEDVKDADLARDRETKALGEKVKTLEARVVAAEIEKDQVSVVLDFTKRELESKKATIEMAKGLETQEGSASHQHECSLCLDAEADALFLCGHVACCMSCAEMLPATMQGDELVARCPICREQGPFRKIFFS